MVTLVRLCSHESTSADAGDTVRDGDAGQVVQSDESIVADAVTLIGDGDAGQAAAVSESTSPMLVTLSGMVTLVRHCAVS